MSRSVELLAPRRVAPGLAEKPAARPGEALLRILAVGICGSDLHIYRDGQIGSAAAAYPFVLGHEAVGRIEAVGEGVDPAMLGQRVSIEPTISCRACEMCARGYPNLCLNQQFLSLPPAAGLLRQWVAHPAHLLDVVPEVLSDAAGTLLEPLAVSLHALDLLRAKMGRSMAILGCGALGLTSLILARRMGLRPILCTDPVPHRRQAALRLGADAAVAPEQAEHAMAELKLPIGFDYVIEASGDDAAQQQSARLAAPGGRIAVIGTNPHDLVAIPGHLARRKGLTLLMVRRSRNTLARSCRIAEETPVAEAMEQMISHRLTIDQAQEAFETAATCRDGALKVVLVLND